MKILKWSSILLLSVFFMWAFIPQAQAKHSKHRTSFGLSFNIAPAAPRYMVAPTPVVAPAPVVTPAPVAVVPYGYGYGYGYRAPVYYSHAPVVAPVPSLYVQPGFSYSYWRY